MKGTLRVLLVEDSEDDAILLKRELEKGGFLPVIRRVDDEEAMRQELSKGNLDIVISDYVLPRFGGLEALRVFHEAHTDLPFILISGKIGEDSAVEAMREGASDYIMKGNLARLNSAIRRELEEAQMRREKERVKTELERSHKELAERTTQLEESNKKLLVEIEERKKAQDEAVEAREYSMGVIDSASEIIVSFDRLFRVTTWNKAAQTLTGYAEKETLNRSVEKMAVFSDPGEMTSLIKSVYPQKRSRDEEFTLMTKNNAKKVIRASSSVIQGSKGESLGVMFVGKDITPDVEVHGKLIDGMGYLVRDRESTPSLDLFANLARSGRRGLLITRSNPDIIVSQVPQSSDVEIVMLGQNGFVSLEGSIEAPQLTSKIREFTAGKKNSIVLLDGLHYLLANLTFDGFLKTLFEIDDIVSKNKAILLVRLDPSLLDSNRMAFVENELCLLPSQKIEDIILSDESYDLLRFVFEQNQNNALVSLKKIMSKFQISYVTAAKRVETLEDEGLIFVKKQGKLRTSYITDKGRSLLHKRRSA